MAGLQSIESSPMSPRPHVRSYRAYIEQQRALVLKHDGPDGPKLWRQMVIGFICAACVGSIMFILGSIFISEAISMRTSATIMLCVMGMVCGLIIVVGTIILGKLFISRKWRKSHGRELQYPHSACFHTCSVIYTPSQDQLTQVGCGDLPPAYDSLVLMPMPHGSHRVIINGEDGADSDATIMVLPPKYDDITDPLPEYCENVCPDSARIPAPEYFENTQTSVTAYCENAQISAPEYCENVQISAPEYCENAQISAPEYRENVQISAAENREVSPDSDYSAQVQ